MRVCICGPRDWTNERTVKSAVLLATAEAKGSATIVTGGAKGVDSMAHQMAEGFAEEREVYPAKWREFGKSAGMRRNQQMLESQLDLVIAVAPPTGLTRGTGDMVRRSREAGVRVVVLHEQP